MPPNDENENYRDRQARMDRDYEEAWRRWFYSLTYGERAMLKASGLDRPRVEKAGWGAEEARDLEDAKLRFEETASHERTPVAEIETIEHELELGAGERMERGRQELRNRHFHLFAMFMGTGVEQYELLRLRAVIMLRHAAPRLLPRYGLVNGSVQRELQRLRARLMAIGDHDYLPLADVLSAGAEEDEIAAAAELGVDVRAFRLLRFGEFCEEIAELTRQPSLDQWAKNVACWIRRTKPAELKGLGESQTDYSRKFGERRATVQAREKRVVEAPIKASGEPGYRLIGGLKSETHRRRCAAAQRSNTNRRNAERRRRLGH